MEPIYKGKTYLFDVAVTVSDVAVDITGDSLICYLSKGLNDSTPAIVVDGELSDPTNGIGSFELENEDTDLPVGVYHCQVDWILAGGRIFTVVDEDAEIKAVIK